MLRHHRIVVNKSFLNKHSQLLAFLGALVVFVTFVVKEGLREKVKSTVDSMQSAADVFAIHSDNNLNLLEIRKAVGMLEVVEKGNKWVQSGEGGGMQKMIGIEQELARDQSSLDGLKHFLAAAGLHEEIGLDDAGYAFGALERQFGDLERFILTTPEERRENNVEDISNPRGTLNDIHKRVMRFSERLVDLREKAFGAVEDRRVIVERSYKRYTIASYVLYVLGWGLGLIGKVYGVSGVEGTD